MEHPRFFKDAGEPMTVGEVARRFGERIDAGDIEGACDVIDDLFLDGSWGHILRADQPDGKTMRADVRGLVASAYRRGKARGDILQEKLDGFRRQQDEDYARLRTDLKRVRLYVEAASLMEFGSRDPEGKLCLDLLDKHGAGNALDPVRTDQSYPFCPTCQKVLEDCGCDGLQEAK